jgi:hypothetical protein
MIAFSSDVMSLMLLQFTVRIRRFLLGGRFGIDVDSLLDLLVLLDSFLWDLLLFCADFGLLVFNGLNCDVSESRKLSVVLNGS